MLADTYEKIQEDSKYSEFSLVNLVDIYGAKYIGNILKNEKENTKYIEKGSLNKLNYNEMV